MNVHEEFVTMSDRSSENDWEVVPKALGDSQAHWFDEPSKDYKDEGANALDTPLTAPQSKDEACYGDSIHDPTLTKEVLDLELDDMVRAREKWLTEKKQEQEDYKLALAIQQDMSDEETADEAETSEDESFVRSKGPVTRSQTQASKKKLEEKKVKTVDVGINARSDDGSVYEVGYEEGGEIKTLTMEQKCRLFKAIYDVDPRNAPSVVRPCPICMTWKTWNYFHVAHIKARSRGGLMSIKNLLFICWRCNAQMSNKHLFDYIYDPRYWDPPKYGMASTITPVAYSAMENVRDIMKKTIREFDAYGDF
jgi:hypothetical protein